MRLFLMIGAMAPLFFGWSDGFASPYQHVCDYGFHSYGRETVESIMMNGSAFLKGTTVLGSTCVNGNLQAEDATLNTLKVNGTVDLRGSSVGGKVVVNGLLTADATQFNEEISIASEMVVFHNCKVASIKIRESSDKVQVVELRNSTLVDGSIVFESGKGEVWLYPGSEIHGDVSGAHIRKMV